MIRFCKSRYFSQFKAKKGVLYCFIPLILNMLNSQFELSYVSYMVHLVLITMTTGSRSDFGIILSRETFPLRVRRVYLSVWTPPQTRGKSSRKLCGWRRPLRHYASQRSHQDGSANLETNLRPCTRKPSMSYSSDFPQRYLKHCINIYMELVLMSPFFSLRKGELKHGRNFHFHRQPDQTSITWHQRLGWRQRIHGSPGGDSWGRDRYWDGNRTDRGVVRPLKSIRTRLL